MQQVPHFQLWLFADQLLRNLHLSPIVLGNSVGKGFLFQTIPITLPYKVN